MPANRMNYLVLYKNNSQVFGSANKKVAVTTPLPEGLKEEDRTVLFVTYQPDNEVLSVHKISQEEIEEIKREEAEKKNGN